MGEYPGMSDPTLTFILVALGALAAFWLIRHWRLKWLRARAREQLQLEASEERGLAAQIGRLTGDGTTVTELSACGAMIAAEYVWSWATIDPNVIKAAAFSSSTPIHNGYDFAQFIHTHFDSLGASAKEGFLNRLVGYVGERQLADLLESQGHVVQWAETSTQPVWDLLVDGHAVNAKTVADIASIKAESLAHPGVTYLVPEDAHGTVAENIVRIAGFKAEAAQDAVSESIASAQGESAAHGLLWHLPWITVGFAAYRNYKAVEAGKDAIYAVAHAGLEIAGRGGGLLAGKIIGGILGSIAGPAGTVVGAIGGGIFGSLIGGAWAEEVKQRPLLAALEDLRVALHEFGAGFALKLQSIREYVEAPLIRMETTLEELNRELIRRHWSWRWWVWPDFYTILLEQAVLYGREQVVEEQYQAESVIRMLNQASESQQYEKVGLLMANAPVLCELVGFSQKHLERIRLARSKVLFERKQLHPSLVRPA
jgi:hypothetical protein